MNTATFARYALHTNIHAALQACHPEIAYLRALQRDVDSPAVADADWRKLSGC